MNYLRRLSTLLTLCLLYMAAAAQPAERVATDPLDRFLQLIDTDPDWLRSRLAMYWHSHATDVYIRGEQFDHAGGRRAPVPTVRFTGTRGTANEYYPPRLEDLRPYDDDDESRVTFISRQTGVMEPVHPSRTGRNIENINRNILNIAADAAERTAQTGDSAYLMRIALPVVETYLRGIYHRNPPIDLNHGHQQTLVGMTSMEVIHEDAIIPLVRAYPHIKAVTHYRDELDGGLKKMADLIIANGVPHNNWDLFQAMFVVRIATVLDDDNHYADRHGRQYYLDTVLRHDSTRQWSLPTLAARGFDSESGIWCESPGYSINVVCDFCDMALLLDSLTHTDLFVQLPILLKAVRTLPQYLMPNRMICGFGDTHPGYLRRDAFTTVRHYARRHGNTALEAEMDSLIRATQPDAPQQLISRYATPSFSAPANSWLMLRTGMDPAHDLAISLNGSLGNHQHANGISAEFYGKGYVLGPDGGIGRFLYNGIDYLEYYSQFPAHNTVCVNGISSYPVMMSHHGFTLVEQGENFSVVAFREPESGAEQQRTNALVRTSATGGYYIDIFRSRLPQPSTQPTEFHDYFYHNLGQHMTLTAGNGDPLSLQPTSSLAFAGGHLYAYSYIYDQQSACTTSDIRADFAIDQPHTVMTLWMRGDTLREVYRALSPPNMEYERLREMPYNVAEQPTLTYVARQTGEAWTHPFVAVLEPTTSAEPSDIAQVSYFTPRSKDPTAVGICIRLKDGSTHYVFAAANADARMQYAGMKAKGRFTLIRKP